MFFNMIMADSCEKSFFKTSISQNYVYRVLHSRFPPFGFVLKPIWSVHMFLGKFWRIRVKVIFQNIDFTKPCLSCSPQSISPLRVCIKARLVCSYVFSYDYGGFVSKPQEVSPSRWGWVLVAGESSGKLVKILVFHDLSELTPAFSCGLVWFVFWRYSFGVWKTKKCPN